MEKQVPIAIGTDNRNKNKMKLGAFLLLLISGFPFLQGAESSKTSGPSWPEVVIGETTIKCLSVAEIRSLGFEDYPDIPKEQNAAFDYIEAMNALDLPWLLYKKNEETEEAKKAEELKKAFNSIRDEYIIPEGQQAELEKLLIRNKEVFIALQRGATKPDCAYPIDESALTFFSATPLPHLGKTRQIVCLLMVRFQIELQKKRIPKALDAVWLANRLNAGLRQSPVLIDGLVAMACNSTMVGQLQKAVLQDRLPADALLQAPLWKARYLPDAGRMISGEKIIGLQTIDDLVLRGELGLLDQDWKKGRLMPSDEDLALTAGVATRILLPDRLIKRDIEKMYDRMAGLSVLPYAGFREETKGQDMMEYLKPCKKNWDIIPEITMPALSTVITHSHKDHLSWILLRGVCFLTLHHQRHGAWPRSLAEISIFSENDMMDPFTGKPLLYKNEDDNWVLYSPGKDLEDNGGAVDDDFNSNDVGIRNGEPFSSKKAP